MAGRPLDLTYMEYELLEFLATHPGKVFTRETLLSRVWGYEYYGGARTVDVHIRRLRAKLGEEHAHLISDGPLGRLPLRPDPLGPVAQPAGFRPHAENIGAVARSSRPVATLARCRSMSSSVAMPPSTSRNRICSTVASSSSVQAGDATGK